MTKCLGVVAEKEPRYVRFVYKGIQPGQKTVRLDVAEKNGHAVLGEIRWYGAWRKFVFMPAPLCVFEEDCLRDIAREVELQTSLYKALKKGEKRNRSAPVQQPAAEPVAWRWWDDDEGEYQATASQAEACVEEGEGRDLEPLYTAPQSAAAR